MLRDLPSSDRITDLYYHIDAGFINLRKCISVFGDDFADTYQRRRRPEDDHFARQYNNHVAVEISLELCRVRRVLTLAESLQSPLVGQTFCSTELLEGNPDVYNRPRIRNRVLLPYDLDYQVYLDFGTDHFVADTGRYEQSYREYVTVIAQIRHIESGEVVASPLIMGAPSLDHPKNRASGLAPETLMRYGYQWYEVFPEDIDEFAKCMAEPPIQAEEWVAAMQTTPEQVVKEAFGKILGDIPTNDWGGERADHYASLVHLDGRRITAAFAFKGPAAFREMTPRMLGKQGDQIYRLAQEPAELLVLQHCHSIGDAVRATLRAFAVNPSQPRRYCLIDGRDTYRILRGCGTTPLGG